MNINSNCLKRLKQLGLPMDVDVQDKSGQLLTKATILEDGRLFSHLHNQTFDHPSEFRQIHIAKNSPTYKYFFYKGKSLSDHGVHP